MPNDPQSEVESPRNLGIVVKQHGLPPRPLKALVVDDEDDFREFLCVLLAQLGVDAVEARHGHEALSIIDLEIPDIVFLDHRMPGLSGAQIARSMHATGQKAAIVLVTGDASIDRIADAAGTPWRLAKPFGVSDLVSVLLRVAEQVHATPSPSITAGS